MRELLRTVSLAALTAGCIAAAGQDTPYWIEPCTNPATSCVAGDVALARWAFQAWEAASEGRLHLVEAADRAHATIRLVWATPEQGLYGETVPFEIDGRRGAQILVRIVDPGGGDTLLRATVVYLTCVHESGHALGLRHTDRFDDIMYSFQFGGDIREYFARYRRKLATREDIRKNLGISAGDRRALLETVAGRR